MPHCTILNVQCLFLRGGQACRPISLVGSTRLNVLSWWSCADDQARFSEAAVYEVAAVLDVAQAASDALNEVFRRAESDVGEPAPPQQGPDAFDGVEVGRGRRQVVDGQPVARGVRTPAARRPCGRCGCPRRARSGRRVAGGLRSAGPGSRARRSSYARRVGRRPDAAGRSAGTGGWVYSRSAPRWRSACGNGPAPAPPVSAHAATRSWPAAASWRIGFVLEDQPGSTGRREPSAQRHTSLIHPATAPSSRSIARRAGTWQDQPLRSRSFRTP